MATPRKKTFTVREHSPAKGEPAVLSDRGSWCWKLLENNGAKLHPKVRHALYPGVALNGRGNRGRKELYSACVLHVIIDAVVEHRVSPTFAAIAVALNDLGVYRYAGGPWTRQKVYLLLRTYGLLDVLKGERHANNLALMLKLDESPKIKAGLRHVAG